MDLPLGPVVSLFRAVGDAVRDRPNVRVLGRIVDHGQPDPRIISGWIGKYVHLEAHSTGRQPVRVTGIGLELKDRSHLLFDSGDRLPKVVERPETVGRRQSIEALRKQLDGRKVRGFVVTASPDRVFRQSLPKEWRKGIPGV